jgi:uncharacterized protein YajQ (UPF0234 family)
MANSSFDIVSNVDRQEVDNALNQASKELRQRFDFKNTGAEIEWSGELGVEIRANAEERAAAALDVFQTKLIKRGVSLKAFESDEPQVSGKEYVIKGTFQAGLTSEQARKVAKLIREDGPKGIKPQIQGDELRVTGKKRDDLQEVIALVKEAEFDFAVQFVNYR